MAKAYRGTPHPARKVRRHYAWGIVGVSLLVGSFLFWRLYALDDRAIITLRSAMVNSVGMFSQEVQTWEGEQAESARRLAGMLAHRDGADAFRAAARWLVAGREVAAIAVVSGESRLADVVCASPSPDCRAGAPVDPLRRALQRSVLTGFTAAVGDGRLVTLWADPTARLLPRVTAWPFQPFGGRWMYVRRMGDSLVHLEMDAASVRPRTIRAEPENRLPRLTLGPGDFHDTRDASGRRLFAATASAANGEWGVARVRDADSLLASFRNETRPRDALLLLIGLLAVGTLLLLAHRANEERLRRLTLRSRVEALDARLRAHFIFNAINGVAEFVHESPARADVMLVSLGDLLRESLATKDGVEVTLRRELELLESYLDVERARFGGRLAVELRIAPEAEQALVPAWLLQPIVENALKHGTRRDASLAQIEIAASVQQDALVIEVMDEGAEVRPGESGPDGGQVGLANVRDRLEVIHGRAAMVTLTPREGGGMRVELRLPWSAADG